MKGFVGIGCADRVETAVEEATTGLRKADFLILIANFDLKTHQYNCNKDFKFYIKISLFYLSKKKRINTNIVYSLSQCK